jgi:S-adenosylmethionine-diacylglycerol 3-amino-3-carboxypropyl transferase
MTATEIASRARFDHVRYAQVWEDADVLVQALAPQPGQTAVSIASAGDNALALLAAGYDRVIAVDLSDAQLACLRLRMAAWPALSHSEMLELIGSRPSARRSELLGRAVATLGEQDQRFWSTLKPQVIAHGIGGIGRFEHYFRLFRRRVLPLVHSSRTVAALLSPKSHADREAFYERHWNTRRWRWMLKGFFSRPVMGRLGRDPAFFTHARGSLADQVAALTRRALVDQDPSRNPYLHWILHGRHGESLPLAIREEHFEVIRERLPRLEVRLATVEALAEQGVRVDAFNLSDIFEYMSSEAHTEAYRAVLAASRPGARIVYWNMMVPRRVPGTLADRVITLSDVEAALAPQDKAFFYRDFVVEAVR